VNKHFFVTFGDGARLNGESLLHTPVVFEAPNDLHVLDKLYRWVGNAFCQIFVEGDISRENFVTCYPFERFPQGLYDPSKYISASQLALGYFEICRGGNELDPETGKLRKIWVPSVPLDFLDHYIHSQWWESMAWDTEPEPLSPIDPSAVSNPKEQLFYVTFGLGWRLNGVCMRTKAVVFDQPSDMHVLDKVHRWVGKSFCDTYYATEPADTDFRTHSLPVFTADYHDSYPPENCIPAETLALGCFQVMHKEDISDSYEHEIAWRPPRCYDYLGLRNEYRRGLLAWDNRKILAATGWVSSVERTTRWRF